MTAPTMVLRPRGDEKVTLSPYAFMKNSFWLVGTNTFHLNENTNGTKMEVGAYVNNFAKIYNHPSNSPGMMATVLRALNTRKVRKAARFPKSIPMVMYLEIEKKNPVFTSSSGPFDSFHYQDHFSPITAPWNIALLYLKRDLIVHQKTISDLFGPPSISPLPSSSS